jgi:hypothetical protein
MRIRIRIQLIFFDPDPDFYLMRIRIRLRIQFTKMMRILADPDPQHWTWGEPHSGPTMVNKINVLAGEHNEFTQHYTPISEKNLAARAELLLDQYGRTGTSSPLCLLYYFRSLV